MPATLVIPIFPLEAVVLAPGGLLPLHIFEPRYVEMVRDALAGTRQIAMAMPRLGHVTQPGDSSAQAAPPVHPVVGVGRIVRHDALPDGRSNLILEGTERRSIERELPATRPYRVATTIAWPDETPPEDAARRVADLVACIPGLDIGDRELLLALAPAEATFEILGRLPLPAREKHTIFAMSSVGLRIAALKRAVARLAGRRFTVDLDEGDPRLN